MMYVAKPEVLLHVCSNKSTSLGMDKNILSLHKQINTN